MKLKRINFLNFLINDSPNPLSSEVVEFWGMINLQETYIFKFLKNYYLFQSQEMER